MPGRCPSSVTCGDALRGEGDVMPLAANTQPRDFNPRPPRGGRHVSRISSDKTQRFQSTSSARRTTRQPDIVRQDPEISIHVLREEDDCFMFVHISKYAYFNPRPPRGGRRSCFRCRRRLFQFQSTSSARRTTIASIAPGKTCPNFNPRPPRGGRRIATGTTSLINFISIHVLREEDDFSTGASAVNSAVFQYTSSARRTTRKL